MTSQAGEKSPQKTPRPAREPLRKTFVEFSPVRIQKVRIQEVPGGRIELPT